MPVQLEHCILTHSSLKGYINLAEETEGKLSWLLMWNYFHWRNKLLGLESSAWGGSHRGISLREAELERNGHSFSFFSILGFTKWDKPISDSKEMWEVPNSEKLNGRTHCPGMQEQVEGDQAHSWHKKYRKTAAKYGTQDCVVVQSDPFLCSLFCSSKCVSVSHRWGTQELELWPVIPVMFLKVVWRS